jgi:hypothetical protein
MPQKLGDEKKENVKYDKMNRLATITSVIAILFFIIGTFFPIFWSAWSPDKATPAIIANQAISILIMLFPFIFFLLFRSTAKSFLMVFYAYQFIFIVMSLGYLLMFFGTDLDWHIGGHLIYIGFFVLEISAFIWKKEKEKDLAKYYSTI